MENTSEWVVCTFHHPIFSATKERDNAALRTLWKPIFDKYKVDLVLQSHDHTYGRTGMEVPDTLVGKKATSTAVDASPIAERALVTAPVSVLETVANVPNGVQKLDEKTGTIYVVSVSGTKMYDNSRLPFTKRVAEDTQLYQIIQIDGTRLRFEARTAIGKRYDAFELRKRSGQINELIEILPEVPEHLRPLAEVSDQ